MNCLLKDISEAKLLQNGADTLLFIIHLRYLIISAYETSVKEDRLLHEMDK